MIPPMLTHKIRSVVVKIEMLEDGWTPADDASKDEASNDISSS